MRLLSRIFSCAVNEFALLRVLSIGVAPVNVSCGEVVSMIKLNVGLRHAVVPPES